MEVEALTNLKKECVMDDYMAGFNDGVDACVVLIKELLEERDSFQNLTLPDTLFKLLDSDPTVT